MLLVPGQIGAYGPSATPLGPMARSSDSATATMRLRLLPAMAIQLKWLLAQSLPTQVAFQLVLDAAQASACSFWPDDVPDPIFDEEEMGIIVV